MTITLRSSKGSALTIAEADGNITDLDGRVSALESSPPTAKEIASLVVTGTQFKVVLDDATELGPYTMPQAPWRPPVTSEISATSYTPDLADTNGYKRCTNASGCAVTLPTDATVSYAVDTEIIFRQAAAGAVSIDAPTGVTLNIPSGFIAQTAFQGGEIRAKVIAADEWDISGDLDTSP